MDVRWLGVGICVVLLLAGGCTHYYKVNDLRGSKEYYTTDIDERVGGAIKIKDHKTGSVVTLKSSEVKEISEEEFKAAVKGEPKVALKDEKSSCAAEWSWGDLECYVTRSTCSGTPVYGWAIDGCYCSCPENKCHWKPQDCSFVKGGEPRCSKTFEGPPACITYDCRQCPDGKLYGFSYSEMASWCDGENHYPCE